MPNIKSTRKCTKCGSDKPKDDYLIQDSGAYSTRCSNCRVYHGNAKRKRATHHQSMRPLWAAICEDYIGNGMHDMVALAEKHNISYPRVRAIIQRYIGNGTAVYVTFVPDE